MSAQSISIIIPSWNGRALLETCLPTVRAALDHWGGEGEVIVVDDAGDDGTHEYLAQIFPWALYERMPKRGGFVPAANRGIRSAKHELVCLLNNDMKLEKEFFVPLLEHFGDRRVFAVSAKALEAVSGKLNIGRRVRRIENNEFMGGGDELDDPSPGYTFYASGGASVFRKSAVLSLWLLDEMYSPFYIEDTDLGYRAWKRGWLILYEPRAIAHHIGGASIYRKSAPVVTRLRAKVRAKTMIHRNATLFYIKNVTDPDLWAAYRMHLLKWALLAFVRFRGTYLLGLAAALPRIRFALAARKSELLFSTVTDRQLFERLNSEYIPEISK